MLLLHIIYGVGEVACRRRETFRLVRLLHLILRWSRLLLNLLLGWRLLYLGFDHIWQCNTLSQLGYDGSCARCSRAGCSLS